MLQGRHYHPTTQGKLGLLLVQGTNIGLLITLNQYYFKTKNNFLIIQCRVWGKNKKHRKPTVNN